MKIKYFTIILIIGLVLILTSCIIINPPAPVASSSVDSTQPPVLAATPVPAATASLPPAATITPAPTSTLGQPPTAPPLVPLTVNTRVNNYSTPYINVNIHCPEISGMKDSMMQSGINMGVYGYLTDRAVILKNASIQSELDYGAHPAYIFETDFDVMRNDGAILSILINIMYFEGGAHPANETATINAVNSNPGDQLVLQDLFIPGTDYVADLNGEISLIIATDPATSADYWFATVEANQGFYLTDTHLVILFDAYTIAPGAMGAPRFNIPYTSLVNLSNF